MKADWCGTWTQQVMYRQGYLTPKELKETMKKFGIDDHVTCTSCGHFKLLDQSRRCTLGDFATQEKSYCKQWKINDGH